MKIMMEKVKQTIKEIEMLLADCGVTSSGINDLVCNYLEYLDQKNKDTRHLKPHEVKYFKNPTFRCSECVNYEFGSRYDCMTLKIILYKRLMKQLGGSSRNEKKTDIGKQADT